MLQHAFWKEQRPETISKNQGVCAVSRSEGKRVAEERADRVTRLTFGYAVLLGNSPGETRDPNIRIHCRRHVTSNQPGIVPDIAESVVVVNVPTHNRRMTVDDGAWINVRTISNSLSFFESFINKSILTI